MIRGNAAEEAEDEGSEAAETDCAERDIFEEEDQGECGDSGGHFEHSGEGIRGDFDLEEQDDEEDDDEEDEEEGQQGDREGGLLLDYDDEDMDLPSRERESHIGSTSSPSRDRGAEGGSDSFYRTRDHVRNLNLLTPP